jgi:integrase/recombinase XerD
MKEQKVSVSFYLEKTKPNNEGKCLVKMVVYCNPNKKRYTTNCHVNEVEWEKLNSPNLRDSNLKTIKTTLNTIQAKAEKVIEKISPFSFIAFEEIYFGNKPTSTNKSLKFWFENYITELSNNGQVGSASSYISTFNSIDNYKPGLMLQDITPAFLQGYENFMIQQEKSISTVGIYLRQLRSILNRAIKEGVISIESYPFKKYQIPAGRNVKKAIQEIDLKQLLVYKPLKSDEEKALDFWIMSYLCNGMNFYRYYFFEKR